MKGCPFFAGLKRMDERIAASANEKALSAAKNAFAEDVKSKGDQNKKEPLDAKLDETAVIPR